MNQTRDQNLAELMEKREYLQALLEKRKHLKSLLKLWTDAHRHAFSAEDLVLERQQKQHAADVGTTIKPETLDHEISRSIQARLDTVQFELKENRRLSKRVRAALQTLRDLENPARNGVLS